jgi:hypothetical protein
MNGQKRFAEAIRRYRPDPLRVLFIAEASGRDDNSLGAPQLFLQQICLPDWPRISCHATLVHNRVCCFR